MNNNERTSTTSMAVTSIRLEGSLKDELKKLSGNQGYQALIRDILWNYVCSHSKEFKSDFKLSDIRFVVDAVANRDTTCVYTGKLIRAGEPMLAAHLINSTLVVSLATDYLSSQN